MTLEKLSYLEAKHNVNTKKDKDSYASKTRNFLKEYAEAESSRIKESLERMDNSLRNITSRLTSSESIQPTGNIYAAQVEQQNQLEIILSNFEHRLESLFEKLMNTLYKSQPSVEDRKKEENNNQDPKSSTRKSQKIKNKIPTEEDRDKEAINEGSKGN